MQRLFTERHGGLKFRTTEALDQVTTKGFLALVAAKIEEDWFGQAFPQVCEDGNLNAGTNSQKAQITMTTYQVIWPKDWLHLDDQPTDGEVFDLLEFSYEHIAEPHAYESHSFWHHSHYKYDQATGRLRFETEVNRIFERNGMAFALTLGQIIRLAPTALGKALAESIFKTGDPALDSLLEDARHKFCNRDLKTRKESLEKLWDAWERLKTVPVGNNKAEKTKNLLDQAAPDPVFRSRIEREAKELTDIGNSFMIRHSETNKTPITASSQVDYLFHRMFSLIRLLLHENGLGG